MPESLQDIADRLAGEELAASIEVLKGPEEERALARVRWCEAIGRIKSFVWTLGMFGEAFACAEFGRKGPESES